VFDADLLHLLGIVGVAALSVYVAILVVKFWLSRRHAIRHREVEQAESGVTVLQAILSGDPCLEEALRRNVEQLPASVCFVWLVDTDDVEAQRITTPLAAASNGRVLVLPCPPVAGNSNPKTLKLQQGLAAVETEFVAVLDDDTILRSDNLARALFQLRTCDLYTGLPCYLAGVNIWSSLVSHFVNNNSIMTYLPLLSLVGPLSLNGMFYMMRTRKLNELGGFTPILPQLCDDYALARLLKANGCLIRQGVTPQFLRTTVPGRGQYFRLMQRWFVFANVLVADQKPGVVCLLIFFLGLPPFLLWLGLLSVCAGWQGCLFLAAALLCRHLAVRWLHRIVFGQLPDFSWPVSLLSELLQPFHWAHACLSRKLRWRTRRIRLERDGTFSYINEAG
jgi:ceramide glucosyltransferase